MRAVCTALTTWTLDLGTSLRHLGRSHRHMRTYHHVDRLRLIDIRLESGMGWFSSFPATPCLSIAFNERECITRTVSWRVPAYRLLWLVDHCTSTTPAILFCIKKRSLASHASSASLSVSYSLSPNSVLQLFVYAIDYPATQDVL